MAKVLRRILAVLCLLAAVFFLLPLGIGILHFGMVWPAALLLLCAAWLTIITTFFFPGLTLS